jgi:L-cysteate sulfo-lyase
MTIDALQRALAALPRLGLATLPTPLEPMTRLSAHLGGPRLWVKREEATGLGMGGNKLRKLDWVLHQAMAQGADTLVTGGVVQSNSARQTAACAAKLGLDCHLAVFHGRVEAPGADYIDGGNVLLNRLFGAHLHPVPWDGDRNGALVALAERLRADGKRPFVVPYGVSSALGAAAYASAVLEIAQQMPRAPAAIVHASGSGGTQAGLAAGAAIALPDTRIVGVDVDAEPQRVKDEVVALAAGAAALLGGGADPEAIEVISGHAGPAYGLAHPATLDAMRLAGRLEGLVLDPVYTGKAMAGLIDLVRSGRWGAEQDVVFLHTGGQPALFAYREAVSELSERG